MEQEMKERMDMFMMESGKEIKIGCGINTRKNENLLKNLDERKPWLAYLTTLPKLTKLRDSERVPHVVTPSAWIRLACWSNYFLTCQALSLTITLFYNEF